MPGAVSVSGVWGWFFLSLSVAAPWGLCVLMSVCLCVEVVGPPPSCCVCGSGHTAHLRTRMEDRLGCVSVCCHLRGRLDVSV